MKRDELTSVVMHGKDVIKIIDVREMNSSGATVVTSTAEYIELPAVCLMVDIMGFGSLMKSSSVTATRLAIESAQFFENCLAQFSPAGFTREDVEYLKKKTMRISDTLVVWAHTCSSKNGKSEPSMEKKALLWIVMVGKHLLQTAFKQKRWVLRGGIAFGHGIQDKTGGAIIGKAWAEAHDLEKNQKWAGISIHESAQEKLNSELIKSGLLVEWEVPFQNAKPKKWVIDWREGISGEEVKSTFTSFGLEADTEKLSNTLRFLEAKAL